MICDSFTLKQNCRIGIFFIVEFFVFSLCVTKLDILDVFDEIKVGVGYKLHGRKLPYFPTTITELASVEVC